jgi:heavy metal translocating P-type ATPase
MAERIATHTNGSVCALCQSPIKQNLYLDEEQVFCCAGCHAVYQILSTQEALANFQENPLFLQAVRLGLISNPDLLKQVALQNQEVDFQEREIVKLHLEIQDMWCPSCAELIKLVLIQEKGIKTCLVDYSTDLASIEYSPRYLSKEKIFRLIKQLGYSPAMLQDNRQQTISRSLYLRFIVAAFFSLNIMMFAYPIYASYFHAESLGYAHLFAWFSCLGAIPVLSYSAWPIWRRLYTGLKVGLWGMEALVGISVLAACGLSFYELWQGRSYVYFDSMTVIIVFVLLGKIIEAKAKFSAKDSLLRLTRALPRRGRKQFSDGSERFVLLKDIVPGDRFVVLTGEKIVLDGVVEEGEGACDESLMTGESLPLIKQANSMVLAGSFLQKGRLVIKVTAKPEDTALHRIIEMIEQDIGHKSRYVRAADQIVKWFVPCVVSLAIITALYCLLNGVADTRYSLLQTAFIRAISVLLISCPCAIGIAAPLAESHVLNAWAKLGAIVRNRGCLPFLGRETIFVFDKTGTVTEGKFTVLKGLEKLSYEQRVYLKGLVCCSNHPIAISLNQTLFVPAAPFNHVEEVIGKGLKGMHHQDFYYFGSAKFLKEQRIIIPSHSHEQSGDQVGSYVFFAKNQECLACLLLGDQIRCDVQELVRTLEAANVKTFLVSGDAPFTVKAVAEICHFTEWRASYHPLQKRELIDALRKKGEIVAVLGDGINDAPALTAAHVGIAVVSATDVSIQVSDILLTTDRLSTLLRLREIALRGHRIVKQNLFWAFFYNVIGIVLAMGGVLSPIFAAFAMIISSLIVLFNSQRIH